MFWFWVKAVCNCMQIWMTCVFQDVRQTKLLLSQFSVLEIYTGICMLCYFPFEPPNKTKLVFTITFLKPPKYFPESRHFHKFHNPSLESFFCTQSSLPITHYSSTLPTGSLSHPLVLSQAGSLSPCLFLSLSYSPAPFSHLSEWRGLLPSVSSEQI